MSAAAEPVGDLNPGAQNGSLYRPLDKSRNEIRVLRRLGHEDSAQTPSFSLEVISLDEPSLKYMAFSYEWALAIEPHEMLDPRIIVDGHDLILPSNLAVFLRHVLSDRESTDFSIWVDSVCINQTDLAERSYQVTLMHRVYDSASFVVAWLGPRRDDSTRGMEYLRRWAAGTYDGRKAFQETLRLLSDDEDTADRDALLRLLSRSYWARVWIVQESCCNDTTTMLCGSDHAHLAGLGILLSYLFLAALPGVARPKGLLSDNSFERLMHWFLLRMPARVSKLLSRDHARLLLAFRKPTVSIGSRDSFHSDWRPLASEMLRSALPALCLAHRWMKTRFLSSEKDYLFECLVCFRRSKASLKHDNIYALRGIAKAYDSGGPAVDYRQPWQALFRDTALCIIRGSKRLDVLICAGIATGGAQLPSWVPDWDEPTMDAPLGTEEIWAGLLSNALVSGELDTCATWQKIDCGRCAGEATHVLDSTADGGCLTIKTRQVGTVESVFGPLAPAAGRDAAVEALQAHLSYVMSGFSDVPKPLFDVLLLAHFYGLWKAINNTSGVRIPDPDPRILAIFKDCFEGSCEKLDWLANQQIILHTQLLNHRRLFKVNLLKEVRTNQDIVAAVRETYLDPGDLWKKLVKPMQRQHAQLEDQLRTTLECPNALRQSTGLCRVRVEPGDEIFAVPGCSLPLILRPVGGSPGHYLNVGGAYIGLIMDGEVLKDEAGLSKITLH